MRDEIQGGRVNCLVNLAAGLQTIFTCRAQLSRKSLLVCESYL